MLHGVDISYYQPGIPSGQDFVICRASHGTTTDSKFSGWWHALAGRRRGAYHFAYPDDSVTAQADHFLATVGALRDGDVLVLDHETPGSHGEAHDAAWAKSWLERVEAKTGIRPLVYTYLAFAEEGRCAGLGDYPLWIADPSRPAGKPRVPTPWKTWVLHQYSSANNLDRDVLNGDGAAWSALAGGDMQPKDKLPVGHWMVEHWKDDKGIADGTMWVQTTLTSGYGHSRAAHENTDKLLAMITAQNAVLNHLADALKASAPDIEALKQAIKDELSKIDIKLAVTDGTDT